MIKSSSSGGGSVHTSTVWFRASLSPVKTPLCDTWNQSLKSKGQRRRGVWRSSRRDVIISKIRDLGRDEERDVLAVRADPQSSDGPSQGVGAGVGFGTGGVGEEVFALAGEGAGVKVGNNVGGCV